MYDDSETNDTATCNTPDQSLLDLFEDADDDVPALRKSQDSSAASAAAAAAAAVAQRAASNDTPKIGDQADDEEADFEDCVEDQ